LTDILCINETEAQIIIGLEDTIESEEQIQNAMTDLLKKCHTVIITLGGKGAAIAKSILCQS
jgi:sugar/nucleoside kinase (ribokinase family)